MRCLTIYSITEIDEWHNITAVKQIVFLMSAPAYPLKESIIKPELIEILTASATCDRFKRKFARYRGLDASTSMLLIDFFIKKIMLM